ncbi:MAG: hypothetical protein WCI34_04240 [Actinomycetes bacterium]
MKQARFVTSGLLIALVVTGLLAGCGSSKPASEQISAVYTQGQEATAAKQWSTACSLSTAAGIAQVIADFRKIFPDTPSGCEAALTWLDNAMTDYASGDPATLCGRPEFEAGMAKRYAAASSEAGCTDLLTRYPAGLTAVHARGEKMKTRWDQNLAQRNTLTDVKVVGETATGTVVPPAGALSSKTYVTSFKKENGKWLIDTYTR